MVIRGITALILSVALAGGTLAGIPMHTAPPGCCGMAHCCETAQNADDSPETVAAKVCCAVDCQQPGAVTSVSSFQPLPLVIISLHPATFQPSIVAQGVTLRLKAAQDHPADSQPAYIRHLALLI